MLDLIAVWTSADWLSAADDAPATSAPTDEALCAEAPRLRRLVHRLLGWRASPSDLDDVTQDVLLAAFRHRDRFRGEAALSTWLTSIALRKVQHHVRASRRRRRALSFLGRDDPTGPSAPNVDDRFDATQQAMRRLAHRDREVLVLRYLEQREVAEIALLLGCARAAVDTRLSRARMRLRREIDGEAAP